MDMDTIIMNAIREEMVVHHRGRFVAGQVKAVLVLLALAAGCASNGVDRHRVERYRPDVANRQVAEGMHADADTGVGPNGDLIVRDQDQHGAEEGDLTPWARVFRSGDRVMIALSGIPRSEERQDVVDDTGRVSLPLVGGVLIEGLTSSEARRKIEQAYIDGGFYRSISVSIVAQEEEFYVRGEVRRPGRHPWRSGMTLTQAIIAAGGYTEFARPGQVQLIRRESANVHDVRRIEAGRDRDPPLEPGDTIIVGRRWFL